MKQKTGPKPENGIHRVRLCGGGPFLRKDNKELLALWRTTYQIPVGRILDAALDYCKNRADFSIRVRKPKPQ
jgi:hypothetical protein